MNVNLTDVVQHINDYFDEHLPLYTVFEVRKQSYDSENDDYLFMVVAKHQNGTYATWTSWNESIRTLNQGHYNLPDMRTCAEIMTEYQNSHTDEVITQLECLQKLLIKHDDCFDDSYHEVLYLMGFVDGITAQQENRWSKMTEREIDYLFKETIEV